MSDETARDVYCRQCRRFQEAIWQRVEVAQVVAHGKTASMGTFVGLSVRCGVCDLEITKIGKVGQPQEISA